MSMRKMEEEKKKHSGKLPSPPDSHFLLSQERTMASPCHTLGGGDLRSGRFHSRKIMSLRPAKGPRKRKLRNKTFF